MFNISYWSIFSGESKRGQVVKHVGLTVLDSFTGTSDELTVHVGLLDIFVNSIYIFF